MCRKYKNNFIFPYFSRSSIGQIALCVLIFPAIILCQLDIQESCCCGRAMYRVNFRGYWNPQNMQNRYDREFTETRSGWQALIGASHSKKFKLFQQNKAAPDYLVKELSQETVTAAFLENYLKMSQDQLRTVLRMPDVRSGNGSSSAQLSVTPTTHLISFFAYMLPTTDWFAGLDGVSLCSRQCVWLKYYDLDLGLFDAGTHEPTWEEPSVFQTQSRQKEVGAVITLLSNSIWSSGGRGGENMYSVEWNRNPVAKLFLTRTAVQGSESCKQSNEGESSASINNIQCAVSEWSEWSGCNCEDVKCPAKYRYRQRKLIQPQCCDNLPPQACEQAVGHTTERQICQFVDKRT